MNYTKEEIYAKLTTVLAETFQIHAESITPESNLFTDLGLDSIDAVELAIQLQSYTKRRMKAEDFKQVQTVQDVVDVLHKMLQEA